ncbi:MAG TPA: hypothetical protein VFW65_14405 [Pseudonocardiaceae bacterium]|nr:hypothetical protein [Pseudonocardiaceae bacterium]
MSAATEPSGIRRLRLRFWVETVLGALAAVLAVLTTIWPDWIELLTGADPDRDSGWLEWAIVVAAALACVALGLFAAADRRRIVRRLPALPTTES